MSWTEIIVLIITGLLAGLSSGALGLGGSVIIIPALVFILGMSQHEAQGTSLAVLSVPVVAAGAYNYYKEGYINMKFALILIVTFIIGSYFGAKLAMDIPDKILKKIFAVFLAFVAIKMFFSK